MATRTFIGFNGSQNEGISGFTFNGEAISTAAADRKVVLAIQADFYNPGTAPDISTITIGGITATRVAFARIAGVFSDPDAYLLAAIYEADVPTGTTANIVVSFNGTMEEAAFGFMKYAVYGADDADDFAEDTGIEESANLSVNTANGGVIIGSSYSLFGASWSGLTEDFVNDDAQYAVSHESSAAETPRSISVSNNNIFAAVTAHFPPTGGAGTIEADGALASQASDADGTVGVIVNASGTPTSQASDVDGTVGVTINATGALASQASSIAGVANTPIFTGSLAAQSAAISGTVGITLNFSGSLAAQAATLAGAVGVTVNIDGVLVSQTASTEGDATTDSELTVDGALQAQNAAISGAVDATVNASGGTLATSTSQISGTAGITANFSGALAAQAATLVGVFTAQQPAVSGALQAQSAVIAGTAGISINVNGALQAQDADIFVDFPTPLPTIQFTSNMQSGSASMSGVFSKVKIDRSDVVRVLQRGRFRFKVRTR